SPRLPKSAAVPSCCSWRRAGSSTSARPGFRRRGPPSRPRGGPGSPPPRPAFRPGAPARCALPACGRARPGPAGRGAAPPPPAPRRPLRVHRLLGLVSAWGAGIDTLTRWAALVVAVVVLAGRYGTLYAPRELALFAALWAGFAVAWYHEGGVRPSMLAYLIAE